MLLGPFGSGQRDDYRQMIDVNLTGAITADDIAEVIAFVLSRPQRLAINEILLRPPGQQ